MSDEENDPRPYDPEEQDDRLDELDDDIDELEDDADDDDDELPEGLPRAMPPGSAARLDEEPERRDDQL